MQPSLPLPLPLHPQPHRHACGPFARLHVRPNLEGAIRGAQGEAAHDGGHEPAKHPCNAGIRGAQTTR